MALLENSKYYCQSIQCSRISKSITLTQEVNIQEQLSTQGNFHQSKRTEKAFIEGLIT